MSESNRRKFLVEGAAATAAVAAAANVLAPHVASADDAKPAEKIRVGVIGPGGMGTSHLNTLLANPEVEIAYVCDVDAARLEKAAKTVETKSGKAPKAETDMRRLLDDKSITAVFVATPDHWHAPAAILALDAGKHVYVEKPCCHNIREGRLMIEAAQRNKRIVQVGTQSRSTPHVIKAIQLLKDGAIGEILSAKVWNSQKRRDIGKLQPSAAPSSLDYDTWTGPAPKRDYQANLLPGSWRWFYDFGCGDMGNDGVHNLDVAVWGLGVETHPNTIAALGGKYFFDDDQQFPDTQNVLFEYDAGGKKKQLMFEQRIWSPYKQEGYENGNAFYGTKGQLVMGHTQGWTLYGPKSVVIEQMTGSVDLPAHHRNFFDSIRSGAVPHAPAEVGHLSAALCHLGNIAVRTRRLLNFDPAAEQIVKDDEVNALVKRQYREHWGTPKGA